jgi:hypothetical protein
MIRVSKTMLKVVGKPIPVRGANAACRALRGQNVGGLLGGPPGRDEEKDAGDSTSETYVTIQAEADSCRTELATPIKSKRGSVTPQGHTLSKSPRADTTRMGAESGSAGRSVEKGSLAQRHPQPSGPTREAAALCNSLPALRHEGKTEPPELNP